MDEISRTRKKKDALALQELGEKLVSLSIEQIERINLPQEIFDEVKFTKSIKKHGAKRRQLQYIGALMRKIDIEPIQKAIENIEFGEQQKASEFKKVEKWRDELINGNNSLIEEILSVHPIAERQRLSQLVRNARKETENNKPPKSSRALFRYLKDLH